MRRRELNLLLDWILLLTALMTFSTGLVLLICFHMGHGAFATSALGVNKLVWLNIHRLSSLLVVFLVISHLVLHWQAFRSRITSVVTGMTKRSINVELIMYVALFIATFTGLVTWFVLEGSSPLFGAAIVGCASGIRHSWIDTHHIFSLVSLVLIIHHLGHRWRLMVRRARSIANDQTNTNREPV